MNSRPLLDEASFQKLLHAAWVLQCEWDLARMELLLSQPIPLPARDESAPAQAPSVTSAEKSNARRGALPPAPVIVPVLEMPVSWVPVYHDDVKPVVHPRETPALMPSQPRIPLQPLAMISGALALAGAPNIPRKQEIVVFAPLAKKKPVTPAKLSRATLSLVRMEQKLARPVVRVIIPKGTSQNMASLTGPVIVLVVLTLLLMQLFGQRLGWLSVKAAAELVVSAVGGVSEHVQAGYTGGAGRNALRMESSHQRVTDTDLAMAVESLSRYEMTSVRRQAEYGDDVSAMTLGMAYELGSEVPQSCTQASHWVSIAAAGGNAAAEYNLGLRYVSGDGVGINRSEAKRWLGRAAKRGYPEAQNALRLVH